MSASGVVLRRAFLEAAPDEEDAAATPEPPRALLFEAAEKKKNKLSGGKLFADLLAHENGRIVGSTRWRA